MCGADGSQRRWEKFYRLTSSPALLNLLFELPGLSCYLAFKTKLKVPEGKSEEDNLIGLGINAVLNQFFWFLLLLLLLLFIFSLGIKGENALSLR